MKDKVSFDIKGSSSHRCDDHYKHNNTFPITKHQSHQNSSITPLLVKENMNHKHSKNSLRNIHNPCVKMRWPRRLRY